MGRGIMTGNDNEVGGVKHRVVAVCLACLVLLFHILMFIEKRKWPSPKT